MRVRWKLLGLAGLAGVAATGVVLARKHRAQHDYEPDELRERLHRRLAEVTAENPQPASSDQADRPRTASRFRSAMRRRSVSIHPDSRSI
jgi:hypothetical protein